jgi:DNA-directed RNA polymerase subunit M/transcription elongation factor TFIIS
MQQVIDNPECIFCHSKELVLFYSKISGLVVQCQECGYCRTAANEHLDSEVITLLAG